MILVAGESLIDLIVDPEGRVSATPGGGPFNVARTVARLGHRSRFLGGFSLDPFGELLRAELTSDGVELAMIEAVDAPTALAVVSVSGRGIPNYWFHLTATAGFLLDEATTRRELLDSVSAVHVGSLGLAVDPMAMELERLTTQISASTILMVDPNCRARAVSDRKEYCARLGRVLTRADLVKASVEDLAYLYPGEDVESAALHLLECGSTAVVVTDGPNPTRGFVGTDRIQVPVPQVLVADTLGAGDALGGAMLTWYVERRIERKDLGDPAVLEVAMIASAEVGALACTRKGADPPWRRDLSFSSAWELTGTTR